ncbi:helix-turn-helix domain-containing protein [Niabella soli]|uniref:Transcriptional regulator n=1 Tax=Niabella soli DSM 19437 TaxID=929713 RepID=W0F0D4_9BACT|nr:helix-turn-helix transcriptional regulator [Niabella soli]AHF15278.1 transcriptional regulator [Niabella soli DSM 19437]
MKDQIININSVSELCRVFGFDKPKHPLITLIDTEKINVPASYIGSKVVLNLYMIALKDRDCGIEYGRNHFDFAEGVMAFAAPKQVSTIEKEMKPGEIKGWMLYFHPDLLRGTHLGNIISEYSFFDYKVVEALHLSEDEETLITTTITNITNEFSQRIDSHSQRVIVSNIELLLNYCLRFYDRQFYTRTTQNKDILSRFEKELKAYFEREEQLENNLPTINYFAEKFHLSPHYFSDLLKKETGRAAKDHINDHVIELAKNYLLGTNQSVNEIAYSLGFNYPHYFTRLFKSKTGLTPLAYKQLN